MNKKLKLIVCGLVSANFFAVNNGNIAVANCAPTGLGVGFSFNVSDTKIKIDPNKTKEAQAKQNAGNREKINTSTSTVQTSFKEPITATTETEPNQNQKYPVTTYSAADLQNAPNSNTAPNATTQQQQLALTQPKGNKLTRYRIYNGADSEKFNANGMVDTTNGIAITNFPIYVSQDVLPNNKLGIVQPANPTTTSDTKLDTNYYILQNITDPNNPVVVGYITPRDATILKEMNKTPANGNMATHMRLNDIKSSDPIVYNFMTKIYADAELRKAWVNKLGADNILNYNNSGDLYINTVNKPDLGLDSALIDSALNTLGGSSTSQTFGDVSKFSFDLSINLFYQWRIFDWFFRGGVFFTIPLANKTISLVKDSKSSSNTEKSNDKNNKSSSNTDFSLTHNWDLGVQILAGYNITQRVAIVGGIEIGYSKYTLNNMDKFYAAFQSNAVLSEIVGETVNTEWQKNFGNDGNKTKEFLKWNFKGLVGLEFNFGRFILGLYAVGGPSIKLVQPSDKNSFGACNVSSLGGRVQGCYIF